MRNPRITLTLAWIMVCLGATHPARAEYDTTITAPEVEVRSGPSANFYPTSRLRHGDRVRILEEKDGWLAILPPPGSFSWINDRFIERHGATAIVHGDQVPVRVGSTMIKDKPTVEQGHLARGAQVIIQGEPLVDVDDGKWWPIQPTAAERRWIPKDATTGAPAPVQTTTQRQDTSNVSSSWSQPLAADDETLLQQARQAEDAGRSDEAIRLYDTLCQRTANTNHGLSMHCANRAQFLRDGRRTSTPANYQTGVPKQVTFTGQRLVPMPAGSATANYATGQFLGTGVLTKVMVQNQPAYVFDQGPNRIYVSPYPGVNLDPFLNHTVHLYGTRVQRNNDPRQDYLAVSRVQ